MKVVIRGILWGAKGKVAAYEAAAARYAARYLKGKAP